jgi:hypothetical protein
MEPGAAGWQNRTAHGVCDGNLLAEEENILGNVALSPPAEAGGYRRNIWKSGGSVK